MLGIKALFLSCFIELIRSPTSVVIKLFTYFGHISAGFALAAIISEFLNLKHIFHCVQMKCFKPFEMFVKLLASLVLENNRGKKF